MFRDKAYRNAQYFYLLDWSGGKYMSPGIEGSRSGGLIAATWASMVQLGRDGYRGYANFDVKVDPRDGLAKFFEVNPRIGRNNYSVTGAGANVARFVVAVLQQG